MSVTRKITEGAWRIRLPLPWKALPSVNAFVFQTTGGWLVLDAGLSSDACFAALRTGLDEIGVEPGAVRRILVSHLHPDHVGGAARLRRLTGAPVAMHPREAPLVAPRDPSQPFFADTERFLRRHGAREDWISALREEAGKVASSAERLRVDEPLEEGDSIAYAGGELEAVLAPGHSPALLCFLDRERRILFSTDAALERVTPNIGVHPLYGGNPLGEYFDTLAMLEGLDVDLVVPSHGEPFPDLPGWVANAREHHRARLDRAVEAATGEPRTGIEVAAQIWPGPRSPNQVRFALAEALAHLEFLARTGRVRRLEVDATVRWQAI